MKGNLIENWQKQYEALGVTYSEGADTPNDLAQMCSYRFVYEDIVEHLPNYKTARILECGCGSARNSLYLALRGFDVTCSDFSPEGLRLAQSNFAAFGARGTFLQDDLMRSKIQANSFDCVMSFGLLEHFEDLRPLVASLTRMVKPGGIQIHLVITKKFSTATINNLIWFPYRFVRLAVKKRDFRDIIRRSYRDFPHYENSFSWRQYSRAFAEGGNEIIKCEPGDVLTPLILLPFGAGDVIVRLFQKQLTTLHRLTHRTQSLVLHFLSPTFTVVCRKTMAG